MVSEEKSQTENTCNLLILKYMVGAAGLEPATLCLEGRCSIQLSYAPTSFELALKSILAEFAAFRAFFLRLQASQAFGC